MDWVVPALKFIFLFCITISSIRLALEIFSVISDKTCMQFI